MTTAYQNRFRRPLGGFGRGVFSRPAAPVYAVAPPRRRRPLVRLVLIASLLLNLWIGLGALIRMGEEPAGWAVDEYPVFNEEWSYGAGSTKVVRIAVDGVILRDIESGFFGGRTDMAQSVLAQVQAATQDAAVHAILLEVDSPGGAVTPTDEIYRALNAFRASREGRRVVAHVRDLAASGGYYVTMASDWIIADPTAAIGSIGVLLQTLNWHGLSQRLGVTDVTIKSGRHKDLLNPFHESQPEHLDLLQEVVDQLHQRFVGIVREGRGYDEPTVTALADGRIFTAEAALAAGLIDEIGSSRDAMTKLANLIGESDLKFVRYTRSTRFTDWLMSLKAPDPGRSLTVLARPRFLFLWAP